MQGHSEVAALVPHLVDAQLVGHVGDVVLLMRPLVRHLHRTLVVLLGDGVPDLSQVPLEDLHQAVGVAVVVDGTALARRPDEHELCEGGRQGTGTMHRRWGATKKTATYQVALPVTVVNEVTSVALAGVAKGEATPVLLRRQIFPHQGGQVLDIDIGRVEARRWTKCRLQGLHQVIELIAVLGALEGLEAKGGVDAVDDFDGHGCY